MADKKTVPSANITAKLGAGSKTVSSIHAYYLGSNAVIELNFTDSTTAYIKEKNGVVDLGGTNEFGTGTVLKKD